MALRISLFILSLLFGLGAFVLHGRDVVYRPAFFQKWEVDHPDVRYPTEWQRVHFENTEGGHRRNDWMLMAGALAVGCLLVAFRPNIASQIGIPAAVLCCGGIALGLGLGAKAGGNLFGHIGTAKWDVRDDALVTAVGPLAPIVRDLRHRIPEDHAVLLVGLEDSALTATSWTLYPRPIYAITRGIPGYMQLGEVAAELSKGPVGSQHPGRWVIDLAAMSAGGEERGLPILLPIDP